ncbi:MAG: substrate-binding domain-containing protein [Capsulimonadaceae bacterium]|nr:substrate-binding domain-containing protein [Capsulimonadaceae bacterium]
MSTFASKQVDRPKSVSSIEAEIVRRIELESLGAGAMLPGFNELARQLHAAPKTVQRAVANLVAKGILRSEIRRGTFVMSAHGESATGDASNGSSSHPLPDAPRARENDRIALPYLASSQAAQIALPIERPMKFVLLAGVTPLREIPKSNELWSRRASSTFERYVQNRGHSTHTVNLMDRPVDDAIVEFNTVLRQGADVIACFDTGSYTQLEQAIMQRQIARLLRQDEFANVSLIRIAFDQNSSIATDRVTFDGRLGSYMATAHLLSLGHRDIMFLGPHIDPRNPLSVWPIERLRAFYWAFFDAGEEWAGPDRDPCEPEAWSKAVFGDPVKQGQDMWFDSGVMAWRNLIARRTPPSAIVAVNDEFACSVISEARKMGYDVPGDISVVGYDDYNCGAAMHLTTVHVPMEEMGVAAAQAALARKRQPEIGKWSEEILSPSLVIRGTTREWNAT